MDLSHHCMALSHKFSLRKLFRFRQGFFLCKELQLYMLGVSLLHWMDSWLFFFACRVNCTAMLGFLFARRERIALLGFLLFFVAYRAVSFVVEWHCCAWILALFLCMQRKNCTAILRFLFYFKMLTKPCSLMERKQCHSLHI